MKTNLAILMTALFLLLTPFIALGHENDRGERSWQSKTERYDRHDRDDDRRPYYAAQHRQDHRKHKWQQRQKRHYKQHAREHRHHQRHAYRPLYKRAQPRIYGFPPIIVHLDW